MRGAGNRNLLWGDSPLMTGLSSEHRYGYAKAAVTVSRDMRGNGVETWDMVWREGKARRGTWQHLPPFKSADAPTYWKLSMLMTSMMGDTTRVLSWNK